MYYNVKLLGFSCAEVLAVKFLRVILGCDLDTAKNYIKNIPCVIAEDVKEEIAFKMRETFENAGMIVELTGDDPEPIIELQDVKKEAAIPATPTDDRSLLKNLIQGFKDYDVMTEAAEADISYQKKQRDTIKNEIKKMNNQISQNKAIIKTKGESERPSVYFSSSFDMPDFPLACGIAIAVAVITFVVLLIMTMVSPSTVEAFADAVNVPAGALVWIGSPVIGIIATPVILILWFIITLILDIKSYFNRAKKSKAHDPSASVKKANEFLAKIDEYQEEIRKKEAMLADIEKDIEDLTAYRKTLHRPSIPIALPAELKNPEGLSILLNYMNTGRAYSIREAILLYDKDSVEAMKLEEIRKQTRYAEEQYKNSEIIKENTRRAADSAADTASSANTVATIEKLRYFDELSKK